MLPSVQQLSAWYLVAPPANFSLPKVVRFRAWLVECCREFPPPTGETLRRRVTRRRPLAKAGTSVAADRDEQKGPPWPAGLPEAPLHAVSVVANAHAALRRTALKDVRLLSAATPPPAAGQLRQPDRATCKFQHHYDRRAGPRRATEIRIREPAFHPDRRAAVAAGFGFESNSEPLSAGAASTSTGR